MSKEVRRLDHIGMVLILICGAVALWTVGCREGARTDEAEQIITAEKRGGVYRKSLRNEPRVLDPALARSTYATAVIHQLFDGLVQFDADLNIIPSLAKSWNASHNGVVWVFKLREGVAFHNGREVTAEDVVYSFTRLMHPNTNSPSTWLFERLKGIEAFRAGTAERIEGLVALDKYTVQITLSRPYAPFIRMLGIVQARVVPREEIERLGDAFGHRPIGTGPFRFVRWVAGQEIVLQANESYFEGRPLIDTLQYRIFPGADLEAVLAEFEDGKLEDAPLPVSDRQRLLGNPKYRLFRKPLLATLFIWLDMREGPLRNLNVRQAINLAINREVIHGKIRQNRSVQARGILPPGIPGYNPELSDYDYNPERARQLLAEAGYPGGEGLPPLQLWSNATSPAAIADENAIKGDLEHIGITIELRQARSWSHFSEKILGQQPNAMYRYAWYADFPDPDNFLFVLFNSKSNHNYANYHNPQVDLLLDQAQSENDYLRRLELYRQAETLIIADMPTVNLVHYSFEHLFQPYVRGIALNALGESFIPMKKIWLDMTHHAYPKTLKSK
jgi:peptide/nickel transport system substrate-binding protein/oligopeptide transport system substrate-binding protein